MRQPEVLGNLPLRHAAIGHITDGLVPFLRTYSEASAGMYQWRRRGCFSPFTFTKPHRFSTAWKLSLVFQMLPFRYFSLNQRLNVLQALYWLQTL